jgi:hypothetical protein
MQNLNWDDLREMFWLVSLIGALSIVGVGIGIALAVA